jgi:hypothetical protein
LCIGSGNSGSVKGENFLGLQRNLEKTTCGGGGGGGSSSSSSSSSSDIALKITEYHHFTTNYELETKREGQLCTFVINK